MTITTWQDTHPVKPDHKTGLYLRPDGTTAIPALRLIDWAYPAEPGQPVRNKVIRAACATHARHIAGKGPAVNLEKVAASAKAAVGEDSLLTPDQAASQTVTAVERLIKHRFWERLEVLGAPVHTSYPRDPYATTIDLLVRFKEGGLNAVASLQTTQKGGVRREAVMAELGAALYHLSDIHNTTIPKAFVIWVTPEKVELEMLESDACTLEWYQAIKLGQWEEKRTRAERLKVTKLPVD